MDVHCSTCGEPWDTYHLWHDAIWDTGLAEPEIRQWESLPQSERLAPKWREEFQTAGYVFGRTVINVIRCPACPKDAKPNAETMHIKAEIENLLAGDGRRLGGDLRRPRAVASQPAELFIPTEGQVAIPSGLHFIHHPAQQAREVVCALNRTCPHGSHPATGKRGSTAHHHMILYLTGCPYLMLPAPAPPAEKFLLGHVVATPGVLARVPQEEVQAALSRHLNGDWGDICDEDRKANVSALAFSARLFSVYHSQAGVKFYIITEHDRSATTVLLPEEY